MSEQHFGGRKPAGTVAGEPNPSDASTKEKLSKFLVVNIYILIIMGLGSGLLLLFGDFEGKFIRVFSTLFLFVVFTAFVARDTSANKPFMGTPIALAGNVYMLALSLALIWGTLGNNVFDSSNIMFKLIIIILAIKLSTFIVQKASYLAFVEQPQLALAGKATAIALAITALFYTIPIGLDNMLNFHEIYWKLAVFSIIVSGLAVSISALLVWNFKDRINPLVASEFGSMTTVAPPRSSANFNNTHHSNEVPKYGQRFESVKIPSSEVRAVPYEEDVAAKPQPTNLPASHTVDAVINEPKPEPAAPAAPTSPPAPPAPPVLPKQAAPEIPQVPVAPAPLPWPVFPDGTPIPAKEDGTPDFATLEAVNNYIRQQFGKN